ncbi:hypothetical protein [Microbacterium sp. UFMG61]|uniref:hypothetical protein n=1 Tax=Microbacterium sp. UFMG61 TaxID=2745935 RepID=UPI00188F2CD4|nr:hypothetical protein [Microbacterium sp. UFMG61]
MNTSDTQNTDTTSRPFGFWITAVDRLMAAEFVSAFEGEQASRRDWRLLNIVDGTAPARRPLNAHKLHDLVDRGWVVADGDGWTLTDDGREAKERLGGIVENIRATVTDAVSPEDLATTIASLEQIARAFGWDEESPLPRGRGRRHGFGPRGFGRSFGRHGFGPGHEHGADAEHGSDTAFGDHDCGRRHGHGETHRHGHGGHDLHGAHRTARVAQHAYERGFDAGFSRGRDA